MSERRIETTTSRTAEWTCLSRAISSLEKSPHYRSDDFLALSLVPGFIRLLFHIPFGGRLLLKVFAAKGMYEYVIARTKYIDAVFKRALSERFAQVLLFGAGFDTRALRFQKEAGEARIFELDAAVTQEAKIGQYRKRGLGIPSNVVFVPIDFDKESLTLKLDQAGFKAGQKTLFILEGVSMYLEPESVDQTFRTIQELAGAGSEVVFDFIQASVLRHEGTRYGEKGTTKTMAKTGEPWRFGLEEGEIGPFLSRYGFELRDRRDARDLEEMFFQDPAGGVVGRINATHCLARGVKP
jgi:methyltransferase (TIGR00027 family)